MSIEIKKSQKPINYEDALKFMEKRLLEIDRNISNDLIWILEHESIYTAGTSYKENEIIDKSIKIFKTNRGGKITYHGPGQLICYFVIDLKNRKKDIRKFISIIEKTIIETLKYYKIDTFPDKENIGVWGNVTPSATRGVVTSSSIGMPIAIAPPNPAFDNAVTRTAIKPTA